MSASLLGFLCTGGQWLVGYCHLFAVTFVSNIVGALAFLCISEACHLQPLCARPPHRSCRCLTSCPLSPFLVSLCVLPHRAVGHPVASYYCNPELLAGPAQGMAVVVVICCVALRLICTFTCILFASFVLSVGPKLELLQRSRFRCAMNVVCVVLLVSASPSLPALPPKYGMKYCSPSKHTQLYAHITAR